MYSDKRNILQLAALLKAHGVKKVVLCPGSRNAPIVHTLSGIEEFTCYPVTDERSAGFFAIGLSLQGGGPVVICCTSGSALLNLHPAIAEAYYQQIPLIVVSADRPAAWIGQMDGQTIPQPDVFGKLVKLSVNLPEIKNDEDSNSCFDLMMITKDRELKDLTVCEDNSSITYTNEVLGYKKLMPLDISF